MAKKNTLNELSNFLKETKSETPTPTPKEEFFEQEPKTLVDVEKIETKATKKNKELDIPNAPLELSETAILVQIQELATRDKRSVEELILRLFTRSKLAQLNPTNFWWDLLLQTHLAYLKMLRSLYDSGLLTFDEKKDKED